MFFVLSKLLWLVVQPVSLAALLIAVGLALVAGRRRVWGLWVGGTGLTVLVVSAYTSLGLVLIAPLENRFARPEQMPAQVSTIIMLGGATDGRVSSARSISELNQSGDRVIETLGLARRYPLAQVVLTGGSGSLMGEAESEAAIAGRLLQALGVAPGRLVLEEASRNTDENAARTRAMICAVDGTVVLVTSAFHMPRSIGLFERSGIRVVPWPVDYRSAGGEGLAISLANPLFNLETMSVALREWIGLLVYAGTGRIDAVLPAPYSN